MDARASQPCRLLPWDTAFFELRIAAVESDRLDDERVARIDRWCRAQAVRCLYFLARLDDPDTLRAAERHGFELVDLRVTLRHERDRPLAAAADAHAIRPLRDEDLPELKALARTLHHETRFFIDRRFPRSRAEELYATWIARECADGSGQVYVATSPDDRPLGYITCQLAGDAGRIGLVGVSPGLSGRGIATGLLRTALDWFARNGAREVVVVTQGRNLAAQRVYQRGGFLVRNMQLRYHKWYG